MKKYVPYVTQYQCTKIYLEDILFVEKNGRKTVIMTENEKFTAYVTFEEVTKYLDERFFFCRKNMAVNFDQIKTMKEQSFYFKDGSTYLIGRDNYIRTKQYFARYIKKLAIPMNL